jgi:hypothetical protein
MRVLVSPREPYDVTAAEPSAVTTIVLPLIFGFFGLLCFGLAYIFFKRCGRIGYPGVRVRANVEAPASAGPAASRTSTRARHTRTDR